MTDIIYNHHLVTHSFQTTFTNDCDWHDSWILFWQTSVSNGADVLGGFALTLARTSLFVEHEQRAPAR
jgi:hypothetical protein